MTPDELALMQQTFEIYQQLRAMGLRTNESELTHAVHTVQMFVINRALHRQWPEYWSDWYGGGLRKRARRHLRHAPSVVAVAAAAAWWLSDRRAPHGRAA
jgi:hypothetical protein